ncbi:phage terminase small subunit P27 family [Neobacillus sp. M.A.Huq-85]
MAGQKQPISLIVNNGKSHMTKEEIERRKAEEIKNNVDKIKPPSHLPAKLKKEFKKIATELIRVEIMSNLDVDALSRYLIAQDEWLKCYQALNEMSPTAYDENGNLIANEHYDKLSKMTERFFKQARTAATDLGLTISSRCKLVVPQPKETKPPSKFDKFGGGKK